MRTPIALVLVALGGALGALARALVAVALPVLDPAEFPWHTLLVNLLGCLLMGFLMWCALEVWPDRTWLRPFLGAGVLGGFTTFSAFAGELVGLASNGAVFASATYLIVTLVGGVLLVRAGVAIGKSIVTKPVSLRVAEMGADELEEGL